MKLKNNMQFFFSSAVQVKKMFGTTEMLFRNQVIFLKYNELNFHYNFKKYMGECWEENKCRKS